jgi:hypothetical protein
LSAARIELGLRENASQFGLLVAVNALVGAMVGLERSTLPLLGEEEFGVGSSAAVLSFTVAFGLTKGLTNFGAGKSRTKAFTMKATGKTKKGKKYKLGFTLSANGAKTAKAAVKAKVS